MARCLLVGLAFLLVLAAPAAGDDIYHKKRELDARLSTLHSKIAHAKAQEGVLTEEITVVNARIGALTDDVSRAQAELNALEAQLAASQRRLDRMTARFEYQTKRLVTLRKQYSVALSRLERRLIDAYETPDVNVVDVLLASTSMNDMLSDMEYVQQIGRQDRRISDQLHSARKNMAAAREETRVIKRRIAEETAAIRTRTDAQHSVTAQLISTQQQLATARDSKRATLSSIQVNEDEFVKESQALVRAERVARGADPRRRGEGRRGCRCGSRCCADSVTERRTRERRYVGAAAVNVVIGLHLARPGADREPVRLALPARTETARSIRASTSPCRRARRFTRPPPAPSSTPAGATATATSW